MLDRSERDLRDLTIATIARCVFLVSGGLLAAMAVYCISYGLGRCLTQCLVEGGLDWTECPFRHPDELPPTLQPS